MGWKHDMWAWTACVDTPAECLTLLWLNQRADDESGECFPSAEDIAAHTRLNRKTVFAAIKSLTEKGLIETKKRPGPGRRNLYRLCYERTENGTSQKWNVPEKVLSTSQKRDFQGAKNGTSNVPETVRETTIETTTESIKKLPESSMRTSGISSAIAAVASAQAQTPYPEDFDQSLFDEAMLATQDSEQAPEALPDPDADLPPKKQRRSQQPRVPFPETLPDDWAEAAKIARPDIDPQRVFLKLRARYAPTTTKKTLATWKREFMNWIGKEFAYDNRYRSSAQKPQRTLGATDTRSLNHRNFGKWASHAV